MRTAISIDNPFGFDRYGFLWEKLRNLPSYKHLDYGAYDGKVLGELVRTGVVDVGIGVDLNKDVVRNINPICDQNISVLPIEKNAQLPFEDEYFDTISILDVLEHVGDQKSVLDEIFRVLKNEGYLIVTVPKKHIFSFLDVGNFKFIFPKMHKFFYELKHSKMEYHRRYVQCENGMFGDIDIEKMWHQHFSEEELVDVLFQSKFQVVEIDGCALFTRPLLLVSMLFPFFKKIITRILNKDAEIFDHMNLFCVAQKPKRSLLEIKDV